MSNGDPSRDESGSTEAMSEAFGASETGRDSGGVLPESRVERALTIGLLVALVVALAGVVYLSVSPPQTTDPFTEFYVLGPEGNASDYPTNLTVGDDGHVLVGLTNHEHETETYRVVGTLGGRTVLNRSVSVADGETWESNVTFTAMEPGEHRLRLGLYEGGDSTGEPDQRLRLWVRVDSADT